jgi:folate-binding protein YgfZ
MNTQTFSALNNGAILCDLSHLGLIEFSGEDALTFLQGQLTNDTKLITESRSQLAGYCTAKGRLLATLLLWKSPDGYCGQLHGDIAAAVQKRLSMYVLRAKVKVADATAQWSRFGVAGEHSVAILGKLIGALPQLPMETVQTDGCTVIRLHGAIPRFEIIAAPETATSLKMQLESICTAANAVTWNWLEIHAGIAQVGPGTQEEFVPQMVNLDLLDGISFKKGCYTGQEIVARTHYLGKVKRRTHLAHVDTANAPKPGDKVFGGDSAEPVGMVVNSAPAHDRGFDLLAEIRLESVEAGALRLAGKEGPAIELLTFPYGIPS